VRINMINPYYNVVVSHFELPLEIDKLKTKRCPTNWADTSKR